MPNKHSDRDTLRILNLLIQKALTYQFYKKKYKNHLHLFPLKKLEDFTLLPTIERNDFFQYKEEIPSSYVMKSRKDANGNEPIVPITKNEYYAMATNEWERFKEAGVKKNDRIAIIDFTLNHTPPIIQSIIEQGYTYVVIEGNDEEIFHDLLEKNVTVVFTHIRIVYKLLEMAQTKHIASLPLRLIITGGEMITNFKQTQKEVRKILKAELIDTIGTRQLCTYAIQHKKNFHYYFMPRNLFPEIIPLKNDTKDGEVVITPYWKNEFPLIRFATGDIVKKINAWSFEKIGYRVGNEYKIGSTMFNLKKLYEGLRKPILYQYQIDRILWKIIGYPHYALVLMTYHHQDTVLLFIEENKFNYSLRQKKPIIEESIKISSLGCIIIPTPKKDLEKLVALHPYVDIRYMEKHTISTIVRRLLATYTSLIQNN